MSVLGNPHNHTNFAAFTSVRPFKGQEPVGQPHHLEWLQHHLPLYATTFIEDHDPEWRDLVSVAALTSHIMY